MVSCLWQCSSRCNGRARITQTSTTVKRTSWERVKCPRAIVDRPEAVAVPSTESQAGDGAADSTSTSVYVETPADSHPAKPAETDGQTASVGMLKQQAETLCNDLVAGGLPSSLTDIPGVSAVAGGLPSGYSCSSALEDAHAEFVAETEARDDAHEAVAAASAALEAALRPLER